MAALLSAQEFRSLYNPTQFIHGHLVIQLPEWLEGRRRLNHLVGIDFDIRVFMTEAPHTHFRRHRFPAEIIAHAVWLYYRSPLSFRDVEDLLAERGISVSFQTVSEWATKFGLKFAHQLRRRSRGNFADKWQLDEMVVSIKGKKYWLWRAVDANGYVLDALLQSRRNKPAALRLMRKLLKDQDTPRVMVTDKLRSYSAATAELMPGVEHRSHKGLNQRIPICRYGGESGE